MSIHVPNLSRLELLREFKRRMPRKSPAANVSPFDEHVATASGGGLASDLPDMHAAVRGQIQDTIRDVRDGKKQSQVILLSGGAGVGKTHLVRTFQTPEAAEELGHIFVGGSNHWRIDEFDSRLLDWVIEAVTAPTPGGDHPLLERIRAIGFQAVEHLLSNPIVWKKYVGRHTGLTGPILNRLTRPGHGHLKQLTQSRNPKVFRYLSFTEFSSYVCDRFLAERSNLTHRYALRVLLTYLFPDKVETGVGTRERVLHWFRGRGDNEYFAKKLGADERPDRTYGRMEAVKLIAHLFSPEVSKQLSTDTSPCPPRVLLLTFDQAEGRNELFDTEADWRDFFAHLSELYNTLPNVVILFTMTLGLRNRLHAVMERQFRDRIRMDDKFLLTLPGVEQLVALYRSRVERWLRDEPTLLEHYRGIENPFEPFSPEELRELCGKSQTVRDALVELDGQFRRKIGDIVVDADLDYVYNLNDRKAAESAQSEWDYTANHTDTVRALLDAIGWVVTAEYGLTVVECTPARFESIPTLRLVLMQPGQNARITIRLARIGRNYTPIASLVNEYLLNQRRAKTFLAVVRPQAFSDTAYDNIHARYLEQSIMDVCPPSVETAYAALTAVAMKREQYTEPAQREALERLIRDTLRGTHLDRLFQFARGKLNQLTGTDADSELEALPDTTVGAIP